MDRRAINALGADKPGLNSEARGVQQIEGLGVLLWGGLRVPGGRFS